MLASSVDKSERSVSGNKAVDPRDAGRHMISPLQVRRKSQLVCLVNIVKEVDFRTHHNVWL
jgi:hypothetical protein